MKTTEKMDDRECEKEVDKWINGQRGGNCEKYLVADVRWWRKRDRLLLCSIYLFAHFYFHLGRITDII